MRLARASSPSPLPRLTPPCRLTPDRRWAARRLQRPIWSPFSSVSRCADLDGRVGCTHCMNDPLRAPPRYLADGPPPSPIPSPECPRLLTHQARLVEKNVAEDVGAQVCASVGTSLVGKVRRHVVIGYSSMCPAVGRHGRRHSNKAASHSGLARGARSHRGSTFSRVAGAAHFWIAHLDGQVGDVGRSPTSPDAVPSHRRPSRNPDR